MRSSILYRWLLAAAGVVFVTIGAVGVVVPGLPTTVFLLLASWCFVRSCPWLEHKLLRHRFFAPYMRLIDGREAMTRRQRIVAMTAMWVCIAISVVLTRDRLWLVAIIVVAGVVGTAFILRWRRQVLGPSGVADSSSTVAASP